MSNYRIRATIHELRSSAQSIEQNANLVKSEIDAVDALIMTLMSTFMGKSATAFFGEYKVAKTDMETWDDIVRSFAEQINQAATNLERADNANA